MPQGPGISRSKRVLFVEDDLRVSELFENYSSKVSDFKIAHAQNGVQALELVKTQKFDAIISDIKMPRMNGIEFVSCVRALGIETPVIFLTGYGDKSAAIAAIKLGVVDFIEKPVDLEALFSSLGKALRGSESVIDRNMDQLGLSGKLRAVMQGVLKGLTNSEIAKELELSEPTVKYHIGNLLKKFRVDNRTELRETVLKQLQGPQPLQKFL